MSSWGNSWGNSWRKSWGWYETAIIVAIGEFFRTISNGIIYRVGTVKKELKDGKI